jgi:glutamate formiminotransferase
MGAADVVPLVPLRGVTMAECAELAPAIGRRIWDELGVPVYLYEESALRPSHRNLADLRRGQFETIRERIGLDEERAPDIGEPRVHPTAGIVAVGARRPLIAFNVVLDSTDVAVAKSIAAAIRQSAPGGLPGVKALGFELRSRGLVQVSTNVVDEQRTSLYRLVERIRKEALEHGVAVVESELVGLVPEEAVARVMAEALGLRAFGPDEVLENRLRSAESAENTAGA